MSHTYVSFASDESVRQAMCRLISRIKDGQLRAREQFHRNVIDPNAMFFEMLSFSDMDPVLWRKQEEQRQAQKSLVQALGDFHQDIIGSISGWRSLGVGGEVDVVRDPTDAAGGIIAEIKNKHNTITGASRINMYNGLYDLVVPRRSIYHGYTAYLVEMLPAGGRSYDENFTPPDRSTGVRAASHDKVRVIDGRSFYELATGKKGALRQLFEALPKIAYDIGVANEMSEKDFKIFMEYFERAYPEPLDLDTLLLKVHFVLE